MIEFLSQPWPWYVGGALLGLMVPILLILINEHFGVSSSFRHICAATLPLKPEYFRYDWKGASWNIFLVIGVVIGAFFAATVLDGTDAPGISESARAMFAEWGIDSISGLVPMELFAPSNLLSAPSLTVLIPGGFLIGFGARYANGCTSGHAVMGLSLLNPGSLVATVGFFVGGLLVSNFIVPLLFR